MKKSQHRFKLAVVTSIICFCGVAVLQSCSSNSSGGGTTTTTTSSFAGTLAEDMMIASPTVHRTASRSLNSDFAKPVYRVAHGVHVLDADSTPEAKETAALALINATSEDSCDISLQINQSVNANCYGPSVSYTNIRRLQVRQAVGLQETWAFGKTLNLVHQKLVRRRN